jgi:hypothetical protein
LLKTYKSLGQQSGDFYFNPNYSTAYIGDDLPVAIDSSESLQFARSGISYERSHH